MIVCIDGCDNVGKSHIAQALSREVDIPYFKYQGVKKENISSQERINIHECEELYSIAMLKAMNADLIIDRHYPGDYAYGRLYRNHPVDRIMKVDKEFSKIENHLVVICHKPALTVKTEDFIPPKDYKFIHDAYVEFFSITKTNCILLDTTDEDLSKQIDIIIGSMNDVMNMQFKKGEYK